MCTVGQLTAEALVLHQEFSHLKSQVDKLSADTHDFPPLPTRSSEGHPMNQPPAVFTNTVSTVSTPTVVHKAVNSDALQCRSNMLGRK